jgi:thimet oligopeptidase
MYSFSGSAVLPLYLFLFKQIAMLIYLLKRNSHYCLCLFAFFFLCTYPGFSQSTKRNPLLPAFNQQIDFQSPSVKDITETTDKAITEAKTSLAKIYAVPRGKRHFKNTVQAFDDLFSKVYMADGIMSILSNASADSAIRTAGQEGEQALDKFISDLNLDENLYKAFKEYAFSSEAKALKGWQKKFLTETLQDFERNGFALDAEKRAELQKINNRIIELGLQFDKNIAAHRDQLLVSEEDMKGLSEDFKKSRKKEGDKYIITLDGPSYTTFMKYAESEPMRKALYMKYNNRAADKNLEVLKQLLTERQKKAKLLGFSSYGAWQTASRMVKNTETVWDFENSLVAKVKEKTQQDVNELLQIKRKYINDPAASAINPWEASFYNNLLIKEKYALDQEKLQEYLALDNVMSGLFQTTEKLFGIQYKEAKGAPVWHKDVRAFDVTQAGKPIGRFYLDLFPRENKYTHAACFPIRKGKLTSQGYQQPVAALLCNFNTPTADKPALLTHQQAVTFFHEFGHVLHNMLTRAEFAAQSGTATKRDFVEAPSQIFENWVWSYDVLKLFAKHYKTGEVLPKSMHDKMIASRNVGSGIGASAQILYGVLDMTLHDRYDPEGTKTTTDVVKELTNRIMPYQYLEGTNFHASFGHLNGYGASYYGYMWSKVYAEDMFSVFEKTGVLNPLTGKKYRDVILAKGGSSDEFQLVKQFLGREPNQEAFLKSLGVGSEKNKTF